MLSLIIALGSLAISALTLFSVRKTFKALNPTIKKAFTILGKQGLEQKEINKYKGALIQGASKELEAQEPLMALLSKMATGWISENLEMPEEEVDMGLMMAAANQLMNDPKYKNIIAAIMKGAKKFLGSQKEDTPYDPQIYG